MWPVIDDGACRVLISRVVKDWETQCGCIYERLCGSLFGKRENESLPEHLTYSDEVLIGTV